MVGWRVARVRIIALLVVVASTAGVFLYTLTWRHERAESAAVYLALSAALEAARQFGMHHDSTGMALQVLATHTLGLPANASPTRVMQLALLRLPTVEPAPYDVVGPLGVLFLIPVGLIGLIVLSYESRLSRVIRERNRLRNQLEHLDTTIAVHGLSAENITPILEDMLAEAARRSGIAHILILRWHPDRLDDCLEPYAFDGPRLAVPWMPVPAALADATMSGIGQCLHDDLVWRPDPSAQDPVSAIPGWDVPVLEAYPLTVKGVRFGALLALGPRSGTASEDPYDLSLLVEQVASLIGVMLDHPLAEAAASARERAREEAEHTAQIAHEFRTPLGLIKGYAATLLASREQLSDQELEEFLQTILEETETLEAKVNELLSAAAWEAEGLQVRLRLLDVGLWVQGVLRRFPPDQRQRFQFQGEAGLRVWADPERLAEAFTNVLQNALKYSQDRVEIAARPDSRMLVLTVRDHGPGVAEHDLSRIFDRFYRSSHERPGQKAGTGLGLAIARAIVRAHRGSIDAANAPRGGLMVTMRLPLLDLSEEANVQDGTISGRVDRRG